jgi:hypothetical protein
MQHILVQTTKHRLNLAMLAVSFLSKSSGLWTLKFLQVSSSSLLITFERIREHQTVEKNPKISYMLCYMRSACLAGSGSQKLSQAEPIRKPITLYLFLVESTTYY